MSTSRRLALALPLALLTTGCVETALREAISPTVHEIPPTPPASPPSDGAVWRGSTSSGSFLYFDRKARGPGDLLTVVLVESLSAEGSANTTLDRTSDIDVSASSDVGLTDLLQKGFKAFLSLFGVSNSGPGVTSGAELAVLESRMGKSFEGDGETSRDSSFRGVITCQVIDTLPGDVFRVYGRREIVVNHELQLVTLEGLVRRIDIGIDNSVRSTQLADVKLTFDGIGVIDDEQRPALFARVMSWLYPF